jgi:hypothetical protein
VRRCIRCCRRVPRGTKQRTPGSTSSGTAVPGGAGRPSGRRSALSHPVLPPGTPRHQAAHASEHQLLHSRPRWRRSPIRPTQRAVSSGATAWGPKAPSSARQGAPAPAQQSKVASAGHQADAARRCIRCCRPVLQCTKQCTPGSTSSCTAVPGGAGRPLGRRSAPSHPALPPGAQRHQAAHAREHQLLHSRPLAAPAGLQADAVRRCIRRCHPVPHGTKQRTPGSTSSYTTVPGGAGLPSGRRRAPSHPALPPSAQGKFSQQLSVPSLLGRG